MMVMWRNANSVDAADAINSRNMEWISEDSASIETESTGSGFSSSWDWLFYGLIDMIN